MNKIGEAGGFYKLLVGSVLIVLFAFLSLTWMFTFTGDNGIDTEIFDNEAFDYTAINQSLYEVQSEAEELKAVFVQSEGEEIGLIEGIFTVTGTFFTLPVKMIIFIVDLFDLIILDGMGYVFQNNPTGAIIVSVIAGIIIFGIIFSIIRMLKAGD